MTLKISHFRAASLSSQLPYPIASFTWGGGVFQECSSLDSVYFQGNAPNSGFGQADSFSFSPATVYCYEGTTGWSSTYGEAPVVVINPALEITTQPQGLLANANDAVTFSINVMGTLTLPICYQWALDGSNIANATNSVFAIPGVTQSNLGTYSVVVTNLFCTTNSSGATLSMYPYLATPFSGLDAFWGFTNTLSVEAWGTGPLSYQWFDDGVAINGATNSDLTLADVQNTNAGFYSVVVSNTFGSVTNSPEQVVVNPAGVSLGLVPMLTITGVVGQTYIIQRTANLSDSNSWLTITNLTLTQPVQLWVDTNINTVLPGNPQQFYQVLEGP